jgi:hypothetical protein
LNGEAVYESSGRINEKYQRVSGRSEVTLAMKGTGLFAGPAVTDTAVDTDVPGKDNDGHDWLSLEKTMDGRVVLTNDQRIVVTTEPGLTSDSSVHAEGEIKFVAGTWEDYAAGKPVKITYTDQGFDEVNRVAGELLVKIFEAPFERQLKLRGGNWRIESEMMDSQLINPVYDATLSRIQYKVTGSQTFQMRVKAWEVP